VGQAVEKVARATSRSAVSRRFVQATESALVEGSTENAAPVGDLLVSLRQRGLDTTRPTLFVIDGAKALSAAIRDAFDHPVIARCQLHKIRNVEAKLPAELARTVATKMRAAYRHGDALRAEAKLTDLARQLQKSHPGAAGSLLEGLSETLSIYPLGVPRTWRAHCARRTPSNR
jgi:transposase-like protein